MRELVKPDVATFLRVMAIERFPEWDVDEWVPEGRILERENPLLLLYSVDVFKLTEWTWNETIGYRVFYSTRERPQPARDVAARVEAWLSTSAALPGSPVAAVLDSNGPNLVADEHETAVLYGTVELVVAGVYRPAVTG